MPGLRDEPSNPEPQRPRIERRRDSPETRARRAVELEQLIGEVGERIRPVCQQLPDAEFDDLVRTIARMHLRFRELERRYLP